MIVCVCHGILQIPVPSFSNFHFVHAAAERTGRLPWQQHIGDPYSVINIFTRRQTENVRTQHRQTEEWKYDDDFSECASESDVQREVKEDEDSVSDKSESDLGSTTSLIRDITESKVIAGETNSGKQEERRVEKDEVSGQGVVTSESDEQDMTLLVHQRHTLSDSDISMSPQLHPTDPAAAGDLAMEYERSTGDYEKSHTVSLSM